MKSIKKKVSIFVTLAVVIICTVSAYPFISILGETIEREFILRGMTQSSSLSKAAERGLIKEDLDLLNDAAYIVNAEDVQRVDVYSNIWDTIQAYPDEKGAEAPYPEAIKHFENSKIPFYTKKKDVYDFYAPILFQPVPDQPHTTIGFTRIRISAAKLQDELKKTIASNIIISGLITLFAVLAVNILMSRLVTSPVEKLHKSVAIFRDGVMPDSLSLSSHDEIGQLSQEFYRMAKTIKEKEDALIASEEKIRSLFERTEHVLFRLDENCKVMATNRKFNEVFGAPERLCDIWIDDQKVRNCLEMAASDKARNLEIAVVDKTGNNLAVLLSLYSITDSTGNIKGYDGYIIDITEKKMLEKRLAQSQRMEAIGTLAGGIAHDFNNLLQAILGYTLLLKMKISDTDPKYNFIEVIEQAAHRAADLTRQLLGFARGGKYITKAISLNTVVENVLRIISRTFDRGIEIKTLLKEDLWTVEGDQSQIEHVILNICINARDAMPEGGILKIETLNSEFKEGELIYPLETAGRYAVVKISDTGTGIKKDLQGHIFNPFYTTKETGKGTGMGLAMAYGVIKNHSGGINVDSEIGKGAIFTIFLPATEKNIEAENIKTEEIRYGKGKILIVDDEDHVRKVGRALLEECGYEIIEAVDGEEAVEIYTREKDDIDLVILDIIMPKMGGKETLGRLRDVNPGVKVLVTSGYSINDTAQEIIDLGARGFIQKPYNFTELATKVFQAIK